MSSFLATIVLALAAAPGASGHTWIEQLRNVNGQGEYVGEYGYPRGMVSKTDPGFTGFSMNFELPATQGGLFINESTPLCHPDQRQAKQSQEKYPRLTAIPGGFMALRYMENGHITKPDNQKGKPEKGGTIFVYGTTEPKEDEKLVNILRWTQDGNGGDKRGTLLTTNDFDDGRCYEKNETPLSQERSKADPNFAMGQASDGPGNYPLFCETNVAVPKDAQTGKPYTLYWVWQWNTAPKVDPGLPQGKDEYYTTCIDVDVADTLAQDAETEFDLGPQQDAMSVAVSDFKSRSALVTDPMKGEVGPIFNTGATATGAPTQPSLAPPASQTTFATSISAPSLNSTSAVISDGLDIPTLTERPGREKPSSTPGSGIGNIVTVTETKLVIVTAPAVTSAVTPGAKFRGRFTK